MYLYMRDVGKEAKPLRSYNYNLRLSDSVTFLIRISHDYDLLKFELTN